MLTAFLALIYDVSGALVDFTALLDFLDVLLRLILIMNKLEDADLVHRALDIVFTAKIFYNELIYLLVTFSIN